MTGSSLIVDLSAEAAGHLVIALRDYERKARGMGMRVPGELNELALRLAERAMRGQRGTPLADLWQVSHGERVEPKLMTYTQTAQALTCSVRTLKRRVADGSLPTVRDGGLVRFRTEDIENYIDRRAS